MSDQTSQRVQGGRPRAWLAPILALALALGLSAATGALASGGAPRPERLAGAPGESGALGGMDGLGIAPPPSLLSRRRPLQLSHRRILPRRRRAYRRNWVLSWAM